MIHDARVVPMTPGSHLPARIRQLHGDPRGRWEGDSLVVESTNFINGFEGSTSDVKLTERYTRVSPDYVHWEITVADPKTWAKPYTFMIRLKKATGLIYDTRATRVTTPWRVFWRAPVPKKPRPPEGRNPVRGDRPPPGQKRSSLVSLTTTLRLRTGGETPASSVSRASL